MQIILAPNITKRPIIDSKKNEPRFDIKKWPTTKPYFENTFINNFGNEQKISNYSIIGQIGKGAYAVVKQGVEKKTGKKIAVKIYEKYQLADSQKKANVNREISLLKRLNHPNILKLYEVIDTPRQLYLITELISGKSLHNYVKTKMNRKLQEDEALRIFGQILSGIEYCHRQNISHRDIKMENILLDENLTPKIIDFGFSICSGPSQRLKLFCGTPSYMSPEIVEIGRAHV